MVRYLNRVHVIFALIHFASRVLAGLARYRALFQGGFVLLASGIERILALWWDGPAADWHRLKEIYFRRLEATTRGYEADADKKKIEADAANVKLLEAELNVVDLARRKKLKVTVRRTDGARPSNTGPRVQSRPPIPRS